MNAGPTSARPGRRWLLAACVLLWICAFVITHVPAPAMPALPADDATLHAVGFFALTAVFVLTLAAYGRPRARRIAIAVVTMAVYGALDELTQPLVNRYAAWSDWLADLIGAIAAVAATEALLALRTRRWVP